MKIRINTALLIALLLPVVSFAQVADTTPPVIALPADQSFVFAITPAMPTLILATATDDTDPAPVVTYSPQSFDLGTTTITWTATDTSGNIATTTSLVVISAPTETAQVAIRDGETLIGPLTVELPALGASDVLLVPTGDTVAHSVPARSVLALVSGLDGSHSEFEVSALQYYDSFGSFYLKCITIPLATSTPRCDDWTYTINGASPWDGVDKHTLQSGDVAYLFFGPKRHVEVSTSTVSVNVPFTAMAKKYDPASNIFLPLAGVTIGITQPNPSDPWSPIEVATSTVNEDGEAIFSLSLAGDYRIGIKEDYYWPSTPLIVIAPPSEPAPSSSTNSGVGGSTAPNVLSFDLARAFAYIASVQNENGSFDSPMLTDWVAIGFANAGAPTEAKEKLRAYLVSGSPLLSSVTDYERHAMALEAMNIDPRTGAAIDVIKKITDGFDGTQIGDPSLVNDDIFALFPLLHAGYTGSDEMIKKIVAFILARQEVDGSWGSIDMTAAAVQALTLVPNEDGVQSVLTKAKVFLRNAQQDDGGFGNSFTTSWVMQAITAFGEAPSAWIKNGKSPLDFLAGLQQSDGGVELVSSDKNTRVWATAYALSGVSGKTWNALLGSFERPVLQGSRARSSVNTSSDLSVATTTPEVATTTLALVIATSTTEVVATTVATTTVATTTNTLVQETTKKVVSPRAPAQKVKPVASTVFPKKDQQASVPENTASSAVTRFISSMWGGVVSVIKWLF